MIRESEMIAIEVHEGTGKRIAARPEEARPDRSVTAIVDEETGETLATVSQKPDAKTQVRFMQAKGGFFGIVESGGLTYLTLPGSQVQLDDTLLNMPGELPPARNNPDRAHETLTADIQSVTDQAMILGAGIATRFVPVSGDLTGYAKPSVPLAGEDSVIVLLAKHLHYHGIRRILVNTYYKPDVLKQQLLAIEGLEVVFIDEERPSGTAGGLLKALEQGLVDRTKPILIMQGDAVTDAELSVLIRTHAERSPDGVTLGVKHITDEEVSQMAIVVTDRDGDDGESGRVLSFKEKPTLEEAGESRLASIGFYVLSPGVFDDFLAMGKAKWEQSPEFDYAFDFFPGLLEKRPGSIYAKMIPHPFYWSDIGRPDQYLATVRDIHAGKVRINLPEDARNTVNDGVVYWEDALEKSKAQGAVLRGNLIVFNTRQG